MDGNHVHFKGGGGLMENSILDFHLVFWNTSLMQSKNRAIGMLSILDGFPESMNNIMVMMIKNYNSIFVVTLTQA